MRCLRFGLQVRRRMSAAVEASNRSNFITIPTPWSSSTRKQTTIPYAMFWFGTCWRVLLVFFSGHVTQKDTRCVRFLPQVVAVEGLRLYQITTHTHAAKIGKSSEETRNALMKFNMPPAYPVEEFLLLFFFFWVTWCPFGLMWGPVKPFGGRWQQCPAEFQRFKVFESSSIPPSFRI